MLAPTSPVILRRRPVTKPKGPKQNRRRRQRTPSGQSQTEADNSDEISVPLERLSVHEPIADQKSEELFVRSTISQSNSWSQRNESMRNKSITRGNRSHTRRRTKQSTVRKNTAGNSRHSSLKVSDDSHGNERTTGDRVGPDPSVLPIKDVVDPPIVTVSGGGASSGDDSESGNVLVIEKEGEAQMRFVRFIYNLMSLL